MPKICQTYPEYQTTFSIIHATKLVFQRFYLKIVVFLEIRDPWNAGLDRLVSTNFSVRGSLVEMKYSGDISFGRVNISSIEQF